MQATALSVLTGSSSGTVLARRFDLRVDDGAAPLDGLARVLGRSRAYEALGEGLRAAREGRLGDGLRATTVAFERDPSDGQIALWHGVLLLAEGQEDAGRSLLIRTLRRAPGLARFAARSAEADPGSALAPALRRAAELDGR